MEISFAIGGIDDRLFPVEKKSLLKVKYRLFVYVLNKLSGLVRIMPNKRVKNIIGLISNFFSRLCGWEEVESQIFQLYSNSDYHFNKFASANIVHFHHVLDYVFLKRVVGGGIKKLLTIHSPESLVEERKNESIKNRLIYSLVENEALKWADALIYPCKETYLGHLRFFPKLNDKIIRYSPTGVVPLLISSDRASVRKQYGILGNAFVISYVGRHIEVKGFDLLAESVLQLLKEGKSVYLLTAGKGDMIDKYKSDPLLSKYWKHIDWTDYPGDLINASDVFILPDRKAFFDLALLEAMSVGVPIISTDVGGSSFVIKQSKGVMSAEAKVESLVRQIEAMQKLDEEQRVCLGRENKKIFDKMFTVTEFARNYVTAVKDL